MIDLTVLFLCSGLFISAFTLSFAIVSQFINVTFNNQYIEPNKFEYYYNNNFIDYTEVVDSSNNDYINGMYKEETPVGLVIMTYNNEKETFYYYCDRYVTNKILEVVCRGFVLKYECYHILVDYTEESIKRHTLFKKVLEEEEKVRKEKENDADDVFAKMKPYNKTKSENSNSTDDILIKTKFNKFKNCGKIEVYYSDNNKSQNNEIEYTNFSFKDFKNKLN